MKIRKHKGINQKTGRLNKGYKYSGKKMKSGLPKIIKVIKKKNNKTGGGKGEINAIMSAMKTMKLKNISKDVAEKIDKEKIKLENDELRVDVQDKYEDMMDAKNEAFNMRMKYVYNYLDEEDTQNMTEDDMIDEAQSIAEDLGEEREDEFKELLKEYLENGGKLEDLDIDDIDDYVGGKKRKSKKRKRKKSRK